MDKSLEEMKKKAKQYQEQLPTTSVQVLFQFVGGFELESKEEQEEFWNYCLDLIKK